MYVSKPPLVKMTIGRLLCAKPLSQIMLAYQIRVEITSFVMYHNRNSNIFFQENTFENVYKMSDICRGLNVLINLPLVPHRCVSESGQNWLRYWLVAYAAPIHYRNQRWVIVSVNPNFNEILFKIRNASIPKMHLKRSYAKWQPFCPGVSVNNLCLP